MSTHGRFRCVRGFIADGHTFAAGDSVDLDHPELICMLLESGKIAARDAATETRIAWRRAAQWSPAAKRATRPAYIPSDWG